MLMHPNSALVLQALWRCAQLGASSEITEIANEIGISAKQVARAFEALDATGLADKRHLRLTLQGLAVAVASAERRPIASAA